MNEGRTVFAQLLDCLPQYEFDKCVQRYRGNLLVAILKKRLHLDLSLYTMLQILSLTLFEKTPISQALSQPALAIESLASQIFSRVCRGS